MAKRAIVGETGNREGAGCRFSMVKERHMETYRAALSQGKVDRQMQSLCSFIAGTEGHYTSSCCSGRIILLEKRGERKSENFFHRKWHREVKPWELAEGTAESMAGELWFKLDPFILHIGCRDISSANIVLESMKKAGVKRGGILVAKPGKFVVELQGTESMGFPVKAGKKRFVDDESLGEILGKANRMLTKNYARLKTLEKEFRKALK